MNITFTPEFIGAKERSSIQEKMETKIEESIKTKRIAELEAMSQEDKVQNHYVAITPEIPKTKKDIDKAIDLFIKDFTPDEDNGEELLQWLDFYDIGEGIVDTDKAKASKYLRTKIKYKEEAENTIILNSTKEIINIVREYLQTLQPQELLNLHVFGTVNTEDDAKGNREYYIEKANYFYMWRLYFYAREMYEYEVKDTKEDIMYKAGESLYQNDLRIGNDYYSNLKKNTDKENIENYKESIKKAITEYPEEAIAYCRALKMIMSNYSERAILSTIDKILKNGTTTN